MLVVSSHAAGRVSVPGHYPEFKVRSAPLIGYNGEMDQDHGTF